MGNALWTGVRLRDVLDRAGVKAGAVAVRFNLNPA
jgi:DMSO/TMAO reductase YedYZ molybdopterin-dependent catalytic subunit